jgi:NADH-quinone oxidoreductase subunit M
MPISALAFLIGAMSISGIPPTIGFPSKMMIFMGAFEPGIGYISGDFALALAAILSTALTVAYTMWTMRRIFYGPLPDHLKETQEANWVMTIPMILLCVLSILIGIYPRPILDPLMEVVARLLA